MTVLYALIIITSFIQIAFYAFIFTKFLSYKPTRAKLNKAALKPISIVICAKNEHTNLRKHIPLVLNQDFENFELIVIDDGSTDETPQLLKEFEDLDPRFFSFRIEPKDKKHPGKKQALSYGVSLAKYEHVVVTDADCQPISKNWILAMSYPLNFDADVVLGISPFRVKSSILNSFFRIEAFSVALQYINFTLSGLPFMGVGRNMAYKKKIFESYDIHQHWELTSGDDDLFVNDIAGNHNIEVVTEIETFTLSDAPETFKGWFNQKLRHYTTGYEYNLMQKIWLGYYWLSSLLLYLLVFTVVGFLIAKAYINPVCVVLLFGAATLRWIVTMRSIKKLGEKKLNWSIPILDFFYILSVWLVSPLSRVLNSKWK